MKKVFGTISILLCIVLMFSSCSLPVTPEFIEKISSSAEKVIPLEENYNGRKNYYYSSLDDEMKIEYTKIYNGYMSLSDFSVKLERDELDDMFNFVLYDNPEIFWVDSSYSFSKSALGTFVEPDYRFDENEISLKKSQIDLSVFKITSSANSESSEYAKEKFYHDYICKNTKYDLSTFEKFGDSAYSVFVDGKAICEGYARAMKMLLDASGIYNYLVIGNTKNDDGKLDGHMWNVVLIDGDYYHIDVTWDDPDGDTGEITYLYFNVTDEDIRKDHFDIVPYENNCTADKCNYFTVNGLMFDRFDNFNGMAPVCAAGITDDLKVEMRFKNNDDYNAVKTKAINNETDRSFFDFTVDVANASGKNINSQSYIYIDDFNYLCIFFEKG